MSQQPKPAFYFAVLIVILGLLGYAFYRFQNASPSAPAVQTEPATGQSSAGTANM